MPVELVLAEEHSRTRSLGWLATRWIEFFCLHGPGDIEGTPLNIAIPGAIPLTDELVELAVDMYALGPSGRRLYDSVFYSRPKGAAKSSFAGFLGPFEAMGPCRFAGFAQGGEVYEFMDFRYVYQPGEPMGRPITHPFLRILATEEEQAGNVYDTIYYNFREGPLREAFRRKDDVGLTRVFLPDGGEIRPSTASNAAKDGGLETWCSFDETHLYVTVELRRMHATVRRNLTKRKEAEPWSSEMSTMYAPGMDSIAERSHSRAKLIREGKLRIPRAYFNHRQAPEDVDIYDEAALRAGLLEAYGDAAAYTDFDRKVAEIYDPVNEVEDSYRYYLNQARSLVSAWVVPAEWDALARQGFVPADGALVTLGFYGTSTKDPTALIGSDVATGQLFVVGIWNPAQNDGEVPRAAVEEAVRAARARWDVVGYYAARQLWESHIDRWEADFGEQLCVEASKRHPIQYDMNNREVDEQEDALAGKKSIVQAAEDFRAAIVEGARMMRDLPEDERESAVALLPMTHDGDPVFKQHVVNARRRPVTGYGLTFGKEYRTSEKAVTALSAAVLARQCRQDYIALPESKKREPSYGWAVR